jgi:hypothetical protein
VRYRLLRMPGAVLALGEELGSSDSRYPIELHCAHFDDPSRWSSAFGLQPTRPSRIRI